MNQHPLIDFDNIESLLPHSGRMILLDKVIEFEDNALTAVLTVRADGLLGTERSVPAWAGIEYMAQAIGAYVGIKAILAGQPIRLGYLLGTRRYLSNVSEIPTGTTLTVRIKKVIQDDKLGVFDCKISGGANETRIEISANLNVYQPEITAKPANET